MSVQLSLYFRGPLPTKANLQREMQALGFSVSIPPRGGSLERHRAYLPMKLSRCVTGFEFYVDQASGQQHSLPAGIDPGMDRRAILVWGGDFVEAAAANAAAAALASLTGGAVFDDEAGQVRSIMQAVDEAKAALELGTKSTTAARPVVNDAAIRRLLKPILEARSDLVLMGGCLFIRPLRHLLRGALVTADRSYKGQLRLSRFVRPLYGKPPNEDPYFMRSSGNCGFFIEKRIGLLFIDDADIRDMVYEWLVKDIMPWAGQLDTLEKYYEAVAQTDLAQSGLETLLLLGQTERAIERFRLFERNQVPTQALADKRYLFERPIDAVIAQLRDREAANVKALKLEPLWQAAPFPVELSAAQRADLAEPGFDPVPWPAFSTDWWCNPPETIGQPVFAKFFIHDGMKLVRPLNQDAAHRAHDTGLEYVLAVRPTGDGLVLLWRSGMDRLLRIGPIKRTIPQPFHVSIWNKSGHLLLRAAFYPSDLPRPDFDPSNPASIPGTLMLASIEITAVDLTMSWRFDTDRKGGTQCTVLSLPGQPNQAQFSPLNADDLAGYELPEPAFADYSAFLNKINAILLQQGAPPALRALSAHWLP